MHFRFSTNLTEALAKQKEDHGNKKGRKHKRDTKKHENVQDLSATDEINDPEHLKSNSSTSHSSQKDCDKELDILADDGELLSNLYDT